MRPTTLGLVLASLLFSLAQAEAQVALPSPSPAAPTETAPATQTGSATALAAQVPERAEPGLAVPPYTPEEQTAAPPQPRPTPVTAKPPIVRPYGILWAGVFGGQPLQSFGQPNSSAPTAAVNPALFADANKGVLSFDVQQTRAGMVVGEGTPFKGTVEIDFVHFDQSAPTTLAFPRLRIAVLEYQLIAKHKVFVGQTWDLFGNATGPQLISHAFNMVGTLFQAGNIGFMRLQVGWMGTFGNWEIAAAGGQAGSNNNNFYSNLEQSFTPTGSARAMYRLPDDHGVIGVSAIGTKLRISDGAGAKQRRIAAGAELFGDITFGGLNVHAELYIAQNLANTGSLNLSQGYYGQDIQDVGGYISGKYELGNHAFTAMFGGAAVLTPSQVLPGYTPAKTVAGVTTTATVNLVNGPGIENNLSAHVGYWYSPMKGLSFVVEPYVYDTKFALDPADKGRVASRNVSWGASVGSMFQF